MRTDLECRGYTFAESTLAMGMALDDIRLRRPQIELGPSAWFEYLRILELPPDFLCGADCGIYNVTTLEHARRRGLGRALTVLHLYDAPARGCETASLQSTEMAEAVYAVGFRDLGRILEYVP